MSTKTPHPEDEVSCTSEDALLMKTTRKVSVLNIGTILTMTCQFIHLLHNHILIHASSPKFDNRTNFLLLLTPHNIKDCKYEQRKLNVQCYKTPKEGSNFSVAIRLKN